MMPTQRLKQILPPLLVVAGLIIFGLVVRSGARYYELQRITPLHEAAHKSYTFEIERALQLGADPNVQNEGGLTPLHLAIERKSLRIVNLLLSHGADPNARDENGETPIHVASRRNDLRIVDLLLNHGANPDARDEDGETPIHVASMWKNLRIVDLLLSHGVDPNVQDEDGLTPLHFAIKQKSLHIVNLLLSHKADPNLADEKGWSPIDRATIREYFSRPIALALLDSGVPYTVIEAARLRDLEFVTSSLREEPGLARETFERSGLSSLTLLNTVIDCRLFQFVPILLENGADVNAMGRHGQTAFMQAVWLRDFPEELVDLMLQLEAKLDQRDNQGRTLLHLAVESRNLERVRKFIELGLDVNAKDAEGNTPIAYSVARNTNMLLMEHGAVTNP